jgi:hypothetical protein
VLLISLFKSQSNVRILHCGWFIVSSSIVALYPLLSLEEMWLVLPGRGAE